MKVGNAHYIFQGLPRHTVTLSNFQIQGQAEYFPDGHNDLSLDANANDEAYSQEYRTCFEELESNYVEQISFLQAEVMQHQDHIISLEAEIVRLNACIKDREPVLSPRSSPLKETKTLRNMVSFIFRCNYTNLVPIRPFRHLHVTGLGPQLTVQPSLFSHTLRVARTALLLSLLIWISLTVSEF